MNTVHPLIVFVTSFGLTESDIIAAAKRTPCKWKFTLDRVIKVEELSDALASELALDQSASRLFTWAGHGRKASWVLMIRTIDSLKSGKINVIQLSNLEMLRSEGVSMNGAISTQRADRKLVLPTPGLEAPVDEVIKPVPMFRSRRVSKSRK